MTVRLLMLALLLLFLTAALADGLCYLIFGVWVHEGPQRDRDFKRYRRTLEKIARCPVHADPASFFVTEAQAMKRWAADALNPPGKAPKTGRGGPLEHIAELQTQNEARTDAFTGSGTRPNP